MENLSDIFGTADAAATTKAPAEMPGQGIHLNIPSEFYHVLPYISNSYLSKLDRCPAAALVPVEQTAAMAFGSAAHTFILEGETAFWAQYAVPPKTDRRTTVGKQLWADFEQNNADRTIICADDLTTIIGMAEAVKKHPFASKLIAQGVSEQSVIWQDEETGLMCRCRPDKERSEARVLVDLKTTEDASEHAFTRSCVKYGYFRQAAFYMEGMTRATGQEHDIFTFIAVEKKPPYRCEVYVVSAECVRYGRNEFRRLLNLELQCREANHYPHYTNNGPVELQLPGYL